MSDIEKHLRHLRDVGGRSNLEAARAIEALRGEVAQGKAKAVSMQKWIDHHNERADKAEQEAARLKETIATATKFNEGLAAENARLKGSLEAIARNADEATDLPLFRVQVRDFARHAAKETT